ncbi:MAG TPA: cation:proton antiporter [Tepidisphaeraceae bacterium]|jgi:CPA2 family monovalent cation:H+ antiporter-2
MPHDLPLLSTIAAAFAAAWVFGLITQRLGLSPIVGYLLAGVAIGPYTPGFVGDAGIASQLAEVGVILLMFGVGLHFHVGDLLAVRKVAIPGAVGQSLVATLLGLVMALAFGWQWQSGLVLGVAMSVASTVVLIRVLTDARKLDTPHGHVAVGWLIVEDVLTVIVLVLIPALGAAVAPVAASQPADLGHGPAAAGGSVLTVLALALVKLAAFVAILFFAGRRLIPWVLVQVTRLRSRELFTLTILVLSIAVATGAYYAFGASMALGAFLAGMVVGQSKVSQQAAADILPLRDAFAVLFFASVGMLFDPRFLLEHWDLMLCGLGIVMIGKPLAALVIVAVIGYPVRTGLTVALALAQIGEFSFIVSDLGKAYGLIDRVGHNLLVGTAIISITVNPLLFRTLPWFETLLQRWPALWRYMNRSEQNEGRPNERARTLVDDASTAPLALILGYGPVGRSVDLMLRGRGVETLIVDLNMDTVQQLEREGRAAIYGDAFNIEVLGLPVARASQLIITLPHSANRNPLIASAKLINPGIKVFVRARYLSEADSLRQVGADAARYEEAEVAVALAGLVLSDQGADDETIRRETIRVRQQMRTTGNAW